MFRYLALIIFTGSLMFDTGSAQMEENIRNIFFDTISSGARPTPIAADEMKYVGSEYITADDSSLMRFVTAIIQRDLDFYADFDLVPIDSFYIKTYEIEELDLVGWKRLGAEMVVRLEGEFPGPNMRVRWRLFDTNRLRQYATAQLEYNRTFSRELAHDIANEIVKTLTGDDGIFRTRVVYVKKLGKAKELFISDYDGANEKQLTQNGSINISPSFAPGLEEIYFTSYMEGDPKLFKVDAVSGIVTKIAEFKGMVVAPSVSPDGKKIACVLSRDGNSEIYLLKTDGKIIKRLTRHRAIDTAPTWSPDGRKIAFSSDRTGSPQIYVMDSDGLNSHRLTFEGRYNDSPIWSQRGDRITFVSRTKKGRFDLASINVDGSDYRVLTEIGRNENPHFSPDGKHIVFSSTRLSGGDIYTMDFTGRNQRRLTRTGTGSNPNWGPIR